VTPPDHDLPLGVRLLTLMGVGGFASGVADTLLSRGPAIALGALASLLVGLALEYLRPLARAHGERAARRVQRSHTLAPPPPPPSETP
jgi:hypothetical protein